MGFSCCKCSKNDLFKTVVMEDPQPKSKSILIKTIDSKSSSEENFNFPSKNSVIAFNQKIVNQNNKKPERDECNYPNDFKINFIYENDDEGINTSSIREGNNEWLDYL